MYPKFKYYLRTLDSEKGIVTITPTGGTWIKALAPAIVPWVLLWGYGTYLQKKEEQENKHFQDIVKTLDEN